jgi:hypothetical protein
MFWEWKTCPQNMIFYLCVACMNSAAFSTYCWLMAEGGRVRAGPCSKLKPPGFVSCSRKPCIGAPTAWYTCCCWWPSEIGTPTGPNPKVWTWARPVARPTMTTEIITTTGGKEPKVCYNVKDTNTYSTVNDNVYWYGIWGSSNCKNGLVGRLGSLAHGLVGEYQFFRSNTLSPSSRLKVGSIFHS